MASVHEKVNALQLVSALTKAINVVEKAALDLDAEIDQEAQTIAVKVLMDAAELVFERAVGDADEFEAEWAARGGQQ